MNSNNENAEVVNIGHISPTLEYPKSMKGYITPNRPTRNVFGKPGKLPGNLPSRKQTIRTVAKVPQKVRNAKNKTRKYRK
jgi:hypothetical protein